MNTQNTVRQTFALFERSPEYGRLKPNTQSFYNYGSQPVLEAMGARRVDSLRRVDITSLRDAQASPAQANRALSTIKRLLTWCLDRDMVDINVALSVRALPLEGQHRPWSADALQTMRDHSYGLVRKLFLLSLHSAQRRGDCLNARWGDIQGERWRVRQQKTGQSMSIPMTAPLIAALEPGDEGDRLVRDGLYPNPTLGQVTYLWNQTRDALDLQGCTLHGLRVTRATQLAQAGCSPHEIAALTGHKTLKMVEAYTMEVNQERMVDQAMAKLPKESNIGDRTAVDIFDLSDIIRNKGVFSNIIAIAQQPSKLLLALGLLLKFLNGAKTPSYRRNFYPFIFLGAINALA